MHDARDKHRRLLSGDPFGPLVEDRFVFGGRRFRPEEIVTHLTPYVSAERARRIDAVLDGRTRTVVPVVEGLVNLGNVSAVMRTAEALGYQFFHVVTGGDSFKNSQRTTQGAEKWLDVFRWTAPQDCAAYLKDHGYRIAATHLDERSVTIDRLDFTQRTALVFGNERDGVSKAMLELADDHVIIPMSGFVQSFNISVAAAVALYHAYRNRMDRQGRHGDLTDAERAELRAVFYLRSVRRAEHLLAEAVRRA